MVLTRDALEGFYGMQTHTVRTFLLVYGFMIIQNEIPLINLPPSFITVQGITNDTAVAHSTRVRMLIDLVLPPHILLIM